MSSLPFDAATTWKASALNIYCRPSEVTLPTKIQPPAKKKSFNLHRTVSYVFPMPPNSHMATLSSISLEKSETHRQCRWWLPHHIIYAQNSLQNWPSRAYERREKNLFTDSETWTQICCVTARCAYRRAVVVCFQKLVCLTFINEN